MPFAERARFAAHLDDCGYCVLYLEQMRLTIRALGQISEEQIAPWVRDQLLAAFRDWKRMPGNTPAT